MNRTVDLNDVRLLMQVVEHGSYTAASRATGIPKSTISQRIAALESSLNTGLLRRSSRSFSLTEAGALLLPHAREIEEMAARIEQLLLEQGHELRGTLRVSCSNALAQSVLLPLLSQFLQQHPRASIRIETSNRFVDLIGEGYDVVLREHVGPLANSTLRQRVVAHVAWALVASPGWVAEHGAPRTPSAMPTVQALCFSTTAECPDWLLRRDQEEQVVRVAPRLTSDDTVALLASALGGGGVACLPEYLVHAPLRSGRLAPVLPEWHPNGSTISVVVLPKGQSSRLIRAFSEFLAAELPRLLRC